MDVIEQLQQLQGGLTARGFRPGTSDIPHRATDDAVKRYPIAPDMYMAPVDAAEVLGVHTSTLRTWARSGLLDGVVDWFPDPCNGWRYYRIGDIYDLAEARNNSG